MLVLTIFNNRFNLTDFNIQFYNFFYMLGVKNYHNLEYLNILTVLFIYKKLYFTLYFVCFIK